MKEYLNMEKSISEIIGKLNKLKKTAKEVCIKFAVTKKRGKNSKTKKIMRSNITKSNKSKINSFKYNSSATPTPPSNGLSFPQSNETFVNKTEDPKTLTFDSNLSSGPINFKYNEINNPESKSDVDSIEPFSDSTLTLEPKTETESKPESETEP